MKASPFGQRSAIVMFLVGGGLLIPVVLIAAFVPFLGRAAIPTAAGVLAIGVGFIVTGRWISSRPDLPEPLAQSRMALRGRRALWFGFSLVGCAAFIALATIPYRG